MNADPRGPEYREAERKTAHQPVTPTPQARAGVTGHNVRYVLGVRSRSGGPGVSHRLSRLRLAQSRFPTYGASQVRFRNGLVISEGVPRAKRPAPIPRRKSRCWN